jgi:DNA-binding GntR family transcriptional regulator
MKSVSAISIEAEGYRTAQAVVADRLRRAVLSGQLPPGSRLLQATVAEQMKTSTTPVREAMRELAGEGLLDLDPHRGVMVHTSSVAELEEIYQIRSLLEPVAIAATVANLTPAQIAAAEGLVDRMEGEEDVAEWAMLNMSFHAVLAEATRLPILNSMLVKLRNVSALYVASMLHHHPEIIGPANEEHRALLKACRDGDVEAATATEVAHLRHTLVLVEEQMASVTAAPAAKLAGS